MDDRETIAQIGASDAAVFVVGRAFGWFIPPDRPDEVPVVMIEGLSWLEAAVADGGRVTCGAFGIGNAIEGVTVPLFAHFRLVVDETPTPLYVWLDKASPTWVEQAMGQFAVAWPERPDGQRVYIMTGPMKQFPAGVVLPPNLGRNDPCPCGSGKKFKRCCGG